MSEGFIKVSETTPAAGTGHRAIALADPDKADEYTFGAMQGAMQGTVLPTTGKRGELRKSRSPFGSIVIGKTFRYKNGELYDTPEEFEPTQLKAYFRGSETDDEQETTLEELAASDPEEELSAVEKQLRDIMDAAKDMDIPEEAPDSTQTPAPTLSTKAMSLMIAEAVQAALRVDKENEEEETPAAKRVRMEGAFGSYRGTYAYVYVEHEFVILVYDTDAQVFSPPKSAEEFSLTCDGITYEVYFPGIEFELPFTDCGIQVMIRRES